MGVSCSGHAGPPQSPRCPCESSTQLSGELGVCVVQAGAGDFRCHRLRGQHLCPHLGPVGSGAGYVTDGKTG